MQAFSLKVYRAVLSIPFGQVRSYKWVARRAGSPGACRAVGQILKRNPYPLVIPCHRVIHSSQKIGRYAFGAKGKMILLTLEKRLNKCLLTEK